MKTAAAKDIKARYKQLIKKFHPDANGGDRKYEARLQRTIQAYEYLKSLRVLLILGDKMTDTPDKKH